VGDKSTVLDLSGKQLTGSLKAEVRLMRSLTELNLSNNKFTGIPAEIGQLGELRVLNLSGNPVTGLPQELGNLQKLQVLDLRNTSYAKQDLDIIKAKLPKTTKILVD
jgi:Leucine-rich repeat (LRR) protein